jgi:RNA 3'-terminal phosphate cyclase (ATP)
VRAAAAVCGAKITGDSLGSRELVFAPGPLAGGEHEIDVGTAESVNLVLQTILPPLTVCDADSTVRVTGGTHNPLAPCFEYVRDVFGPLASSMNVQAYYEMERPGFYPSGGGKVRMAVCGLECAQDVGALRFMSRGELRRIEGLSAASDSLPEHIVDRQAARATSRLAEAGHSVRMERARWATASPGTVVFLRAVYSRTVAGFFSLGKLGKPAETVADEAADAMLDFLSGTGALDSHAADQLITLAALCEGPSRFTCHRVTSHLRTNAEVIRQITGRTVEIAEAADGTGSVILPPEAGWEEPEI